MPPPRCVRHLLLIRLYGRSAAGKSGRGACGGSPVHGEEAMPPEAGSVWKLHQVQGPSAAHTDSDLAAVSRFAANSEAFWFAPQPAVRAAFWYDDGQGWRPYAVPPACPMLRRAVSPPCPASRPALSRGGSAPRARWRARSGMTTARAGATTKMRWPHWAPRRHRVASPHCRASRPAWRSGGSASTARCRARSGTTTPTPPGSAIR